MHKVALLFTVVALVSGCTSRDVTALPKYHVGYVPNHLYALKVERELVHFIERNDDILSLVKAEGLETADWLQPIGRLPIGTRIRVDQLLYETSMDLSGVSRYVIAYGRVMDGPHTGAKVVMTGVSERIDFPQAVLRSRALAPDPALVDDLGLHDSADSG